MRFKTKYRWLNLTIAAFLMFAVAAGMIGRGSQTADMPEFSLIRDEWECTVFGRAKEGKFPPPEPLVLTPEERADRITRHADECLQLADKHPDTLDALAALYLAACRAPGLDAGKQAMRRLSVRMSTIDLGEFERAVTAGRVDAPDAKHVYDEIAPVIIERIKQSPDQPRAAALLTQICAVLGFDSQTAAPPQHFTEAADLIAARYANSPDIFNFCEILGGGMHASPHWAGGFEKHMQTILAGNEERWVRCTGSLALASIAQLSIDRQAEAEELYEQFLADFDGQTKGQWQAVEQMVNDNARQRLTAMQFAPIGRPAPEILGIDLEGQPMKLSDYRGKVVVVSFWATWCLPCMKLIPHERELAIRLSDKPFAIVGVNGNTTEESIRKAVDQYGITWRSFQDVRPGKESISEEWNAVYPTVFLIDHKGIFRKRWTGEPPIDVLNRMVDELVAEAVDKGTD